MNSMLKAACAIALATHVLTVSLAGFAQTQQKFPTKPIRLLVGYGPGSQIDASARLLGQKMSEHWGQAVVVDNRPGAGGTLAASVVAKAAPDGHTLLLAGTNFASSAALQPTLPYDPLKDFAGITPIGLGAQVLVVAPALGVSSVKDLIVLAKAQPGKIIFGSSATGTGGHLSGARFNVAAGIKVVHVAFQTGAMIETMTGRTHYSMVNLPVALPFIKDGKLLALAVNTPQRSPVLPDAPALAETLPEFKRHDASGGLLAPARTPHPILNQISKEVARILNLPDIKERLQAMAFIPAPSTPEEHDRILRDEIESVSRLVRDAGLKPK